MYSIYLLLFFLKNPKVYNVTETGQNLCFYVFRYIMTSEFTLAPTKKFFEENHYFGLEPANIIMFEQRMIPAVTFDGKVIMQSKGKIAMAPGRCKEVHQKKSVKFHHFKDG